MQVFAWVGACHIAHFEANKVLSARISAFFMRLVNREEFDYWAAVSEQGQSLNELRALDAALEIKELANLQGGWEMHHGIGLDMVSEVLVEQSDWHPDDVHDFVERLSEGFFSFSDIYDEED